jgi:hypothetical protein
MRRTEDDATAAGEADREPPYDLVYARIARTLERLCDECGWGNVITVFSSDRARRERAAQRRRAGCRPDRPPPPPPPASRRLGSLRS